MIEIPRQHAIYRWECVVGGCERSRSGGTDLCSEHLQQLARERERGVGKAAFLTAATGLKRHVRAEELACRVCPQRPVAHTELRLCQRHLSRWQHHERTNGENADLAAWLSEQLPLARLRIVSGGGLYQPGRLTTWLVPVAWQPLPP